MLPGIVGLKVELSNIEGKLKLGQLRKKEDQVGVYNALTQSSNLQDQALAHYMKKINSGTGGT
ncbi:hypothetical protein [Neptunomonas qingdaonensis]|uniref:Transcriptional regulator n=1 Tax=Neptunomonas qingdaonensis TaxID=1045558 RepID=A0A1I2NAX5_9GAMM|nr:hypothetical protein [Neptunomonas qingdaonensis]SFF98656.1 transcriptional regulator [Neptunomonas qingdaonensis]